MMTSTDSELQLQEPKQQLVNKEQLCKEQLNKEQLCKEQLNKEQLNNEQLNREQLNREQLKNEQLLNQQLSTKQLLTELHQYEADSRIEWTDGRAVSATNNEIASASREYNNSISQAAIKCNNICDTSSVVKTNSETCTAKDVPQSADGANRSIVLDIRPTDAATCTDVVKTENCSTDLSRNTDSVNRFNRMDHSISGGATRDESSGRSVVLSSDHQPLVDSELSDSYNGIDDFELSEKSAVGNKNDGDLIGNSAHFCNIHGKEELISHRDGTGENKHLNPSLNRWTEKNCPMHHPGISHGSSTRQADDAYRLVSNNVDPSDVICNGSYSSNVSCRQRRNIPIVRENLKINQHPNNCCDINVKLSEAACDSFSNTSSSGFVRNGSVISSGINDIPVVRENQEAKKQLDVSYDSNIKSSSANCNGIVNKKRDVPVICENPASNHTISDSTSRSDSVSNHVQWNAPISNRESNNNHFDSERCHTAGDINRDESQDNHGSTVRCFSGNDQNPDKSNSTGCWLQYIEEKRTCLSGCMNTRAGPHRAYEPTEVEHIANIITHAFWIVPSIIGLWWMTCLSSNQKQQFTALIYGLALFFLFSVSAIYHILAYSTQFKTMKYIFHIGDRATIYMFIAASYTPWLLLKDFNDWEPIILSVVWCAAFIGIIYQYTFHEQYKMLETIFYVIIGVCPAIIIVEMEEPTGLFELFLGGLAYIFGLIFFKSDGIIPFAHAIWHVFVFIGAAFHFYAICRHLLGTAMADNAITDSSPSLL